MCPSHSCRFTHFSSTQARDKPRELCTFFPIHPPAGVKMLNSGSLPKTFLLAAVLVALVQVGHGQVGKPTECCTKVSYKEITEDVFAFRVQIPQAPCLPAIIFYTKDNYYCAAINAPWARQKASAIRKAAAAAAAASATSPPSKSSLLAILTSSAPSSPPPSSSSPSSSSFSPRLRPTLR